MKRTSHFLLAIAFLLLYNPLLKAKEGWTFRASMPTARSGICAAVFEGKVYVIGGQDRNGQVLNLVERYDPGSETWETDLPALKVKRVNAAAVVFDGKIFVLGGRRDKRKVLKKVEFFDPSRNKWEFSEDLGEEREGLAAVVLNGLMYAVGGSNEKGRPLNSVEFYDINTDEWEESEEWHLSSGRASFSSIAIEDSAFTIGGFFFGPVRTVERYHTTTGVTIRSSLLHGRGSFGAAALRDTIYVMGGRGQRDQVLSSVEFFVPNLNRWEETLRESFAAVTVNNNIFVIGGRDPDGNVLASVEMFDLATSVADRGSFIPSDFNLRQNYPNPFNAGTKIKFQVSSKSSSATVNLSIYNLHGQLITTLVNDEQLIPGEHEVSWGGKDQHGLPVASGIYVYTLQQGQNKQSKKMTLIR
ncbi:MAG: kelch repeat-containing protein [bacterium]